MSRDKAIKQKQNKKTFQKSKKSVDNELCLWYNDYSKDKELIRMAVKWFIYTFVDGSQTIAQKLNSVELSRLTHDHGKLIKKERYKG